MGEPKRRSRKRSRSKNPPPLKGFTLYLCQCVDYDDLANTLNRAGIRIKRHREFFSADAPDPELLKLVGEKRWILITGDRRQRVKPLERQAIKQYRVREFVISGTGNLGQRIVNARRKIRNLCRTNRGPFVAAILDSGDIALRKLDDPPKSN
jgi:hypothetical protein